MQYAILLQRRADGSYQASVPLLPGVTRTAATRTDVLQLVHTALAEALETTEVLYVTIPDASPAAPHPWLETAGMFHDDPTLEPLLAAIYAERDVE